MLPAKLMVTIGEHLAAKAPLLRHFGGWTCLLSYQGFHRISVMSLQTGLGHVSMA